MFLSLQFFLKPKFLLVCGLLGVLLLALGIVLGYQVVPNLIENKIWETKVIEPDTQGWDLFVKTPFPFSFKVYLFNIENVQEIMQGAKPKVREIGPFTYKLDRWKSEIEWEKDNVSYNEYLLFRFDQEASFGRSEDDFVTVLNTPYLSLLLTVEDLSPATLQSVEPVLPAVFSDHNSLFIRVKVRDYLFGGVKMCGKDALSGDFMTKVVCKQVLAKAKTTKTMRIDDQTVWFSNFFFKNNTHQDRYTVKSGKEDRQGTGKLVKYGNKEYLDVWPGENNLCNKIRGPTTVFPTKIDDQMEFEVFGEDICRTITLKFKTKERLQDITGLVFAATNTSFYAKEEDDLTSCFCSNTSRRLDGTMGCLENGLLDLNPCTGAPVLLSFPHLLHADQSYQDTVSGLKPNASLHETELVLEPISGTPLRMAKRVQFNMFIRPMEGVEALDNLTYSLVPIFWVEESMIIGDAFIDLLKNKLLRMIGIFEVVRWVLIILGIACIVVPVFVFIYNQE